METSASFEARSAPLPYPTANERSYGSVRGVPGNWYPYRDRLHRESRARRPKMLRQMISVVVLVHLERELFAALKGQLSLNHRNVLREDSSNRYFFNF